MWPSRTKHPRKIIVPVIVSKANLQRFAFFVARESAPKRREVVRNGTLGNLL